MTLTPFINTAAIIISSMGSVALGITLISISGDREDIKGAITGLMFILAGLWSLISCLSGSV